MDRDILFAVRNNFYIGAYNNAINEASDMEGLSEAEQTERDVYVYRSYIALGSHDVSVLLLLLLVLVLLVLVLVLCTVSLEKQHAGSSSRQLQVVAQQHSAAG